MTDDILKDARDVFETMVEAEAANRITHLEDIRFGRLGEQWPEDIRQRRADEQRPCLTINHMPASIRQVVNDARQNKPAIKVHPADDSADVETADIINGIIRNIEYTSKADVAYDTALECAVTGGWGYFTIDTEYAGDGFDLDIVIKAVPNPLTIYGDPYSTASDSSDWNDAFQTEMLTRPDFKRRFKGADAVDWDALGYDGLDTNWCDGKGDKQRVLVAKWWRREQVKKALLMLSDQSVVYDDVFAQRLDEYRAKGIDVVGEREVDGHKVSWKLLTGAEEIDGGDWAGRFIPIVPVYGEVINVEGKRHLRSMIRDGRDAQMMYNFNRTASTEMLALQPKVPFIGPKGAFDHDIAKWETANTDAHAFIEYSGAIPPQRQPPPAAALGNIQEAAIASDDLKRILGIHDPSLGAMPETAGEMSGKALIGWQKKGEVSNFHFIDNLARAIHHAGLIVIDLIPHVYDGARTMRIMGPDKNPTNEKVNQPVQVPQKDPQGNPVADPATGQPIMMERVYDITAGKYDLTVEAGPSFATRREEAAFQMIQLIQADPQLAAPLGGLLAKNLDWHDADEVARILDGMGQSGDKAAQAEQAKVQAEMQAQMAKLQQEGQIKMATLQQEGQFKAQQAQADIAHQRELGAAQIQLKREQLQAELVLKREELQAEMEMKLQEMQANHALKAQQAARDADRSDAETDANISSSVRPGGEPG